MMAATRKFKAIDIDKYVELHLKINHGTSRREITAALHDVLQKHQAGKKCSCGNPIWVIGSAAGSCLGCFTCITGEAAPNDDYEITEAIQ